MGASGIPLALGIVCSILLRSVIAKPRSCFDMLCPRLPVEKEPALSYLY